MVVADFFGGSGVTAAVASRLDCKFVHCDIGLNSIQVARDRLKADGAYCDESPIGLLMHDFSCKSPDDIKY